MSVAVMPSERLRTVRLYGKLGAQFGRVHRLAVASTAEGVRALCAILPGFELELTTSKDRGIAYAVFIGKTNITADQLRDPVGSDDIRIAPVIQGAKRGVLQTIIGVVLIVVGALTSWAGGGALVSLGVSMVIGGVTQMLTPLPKGLSARDRPENGASYNFNGPVNTSAQGNPVPVGYGRMLVGSAVISAGIYAEDQQ